MIQFFKMYKINVLFVETNINNNKNNLRQQQKMFLHISTIIFSVLVFCCYRTNANLQALHDHETMRKHIEHMTNYLEEGFTKNQQPRTPQGKKVRRDENHEIYNQRHHVYVTE